jgi:hypothetical protein
MIDATRSVVERINVHSAVRLQVSRGTAVPISGSCKGQQFQACTGREAPRKEGRKSVISQDGGDEAFSVVRGLKTRSRITITRFSRSACCDPSSAAVLCSLSKKRLIAGDTARRIVDPPFLVYQSHETEIAQTSTDGTPWMPNHPPTRRTGLDPCGRSWTHRTRASSTSRPSGKV